MTLDEYDQLKRGDGVVIWFGNYGGTQYAIVHHRTTNGRVHVCKWRARSRRWTKPIPVGPDEVLRRAKHGEYQVSPWPEELRKL